MHEGGGAKAIEAQHKKGRLTARERIALLLDPKTDFFELGVYAAYRNVPGMGRSSGGGRSYRAGARRGTAGDDYRQ